MAAYTLCISDGMSRNGGGQTTIEAADDAAAVLAWREWAKEGDYTTTDGRWVTVRGSVWCGDRHVHDTVTQAPSTVEG